MYCPCKDCERKGCGSYHDICEDYQKFLEQQGRARKQKSNIRELNDYFTTAKQKRG